MWKYIQAQTYYIYNQLSHTCGNIFKPHIQSSITYMWKYIQAQTYYIYNQLSHTCGNIFKPKPITYTIITYMWKYIQATYTIKYHIHVEIYSSPNLLHIQSIITYMWKYIQAQTYYIYNQLSHTCGNIFKPKPITYTINYHIRVEIYSSPNLLHIQSSITNMWKYIQAQTYYIYNQLSHTCRNIFKPKPITYTINYHIHVEIYSSPNLLHIQSIITNMWKYIQAQTYYIYNQLSHTCGNIFKPKPITYTINYHKHVEIYSSPNLLHIQSIITYMWKYIQAQTYYIYNQLSQTCGNIFKPKPITYTINYHIHVEIYSSPNLLHIQSIITNMWKYIQAQQIWTAAFSHNRQNKKVSPTPTGQ